MAGKDGGPSLWGWLLLGGAGYLAYEWFFASSTSAAVSAGPSTTPPAGGSPPASAPPAASPASGYNSLDQTYQRLVQTLQQNSSDPALAQVQGSLQATPDVFNYYLARVSAYSLDGPGMQQAFGPAPHQPISLGAFWSAASAWLAQTKGLSGIGGRGLAGIFAGAGRRR